MRHELDIVAALAAGFPAGTVSGAPKVRAMEIIDELEKDKRGVYAGCIGYFGAGGEMDTCIVLRASVVKDGVMHVQAGAGVVYDSDPGLRTARMRQQGPGAVSRRRGSGAVRHQGEAGAVAAKRARHQRRRARAASATHLIGGAYCSPPWVHSAFSPRLILIGEPMPTLRSKNSP